MQPLPQRTDDAPWLLSSVLRRDERAWRELMRRYRGLLFSCIQRGAARRGFPLSHADADEIFCELCLTLLRNDMRKLRAFDPGRGACLGTWLGLLAIHATYDYLRTFDRHGHGPGVPLDEAPEPAASQPSALDSLLVKEQCERLLAFLEERFSEHERHFVDLYYGEGLEPAEIAGRLRISMATVYSKKHKLQAKLQALATGEGERRPTQLQAA